MYSNLVHLDFVMQFLVALRLLMFRLVVFPFSNLYKTDIIDLNGSIGLVECSNCIDYPRHKSRSLDEVMCRNNRTLENSKEVWIYSTLDTFCMRQYINVC